MLIAKVIGSIVATRKNEGLLGQKLMVVELSDSSKIVAIDNVGAGVGDNVIIAQGSAARIGCGLEMSPVDAAIVGIIDD